MHLLYNFFIIISNDLNFEFQRWQFNKYNNSLKFFFWGNILDTPDSDLNGASLSASKLSISILLKVDNSLSD